MAQLNHDDWIDDVTLDGTGSGVVDLGAAPATDVTDIGSNPDNRRALYQVQAERGVEFLRSEQPSEFDHPQVQPASERGEDLQATAELAQSMLGSDCVMDGYMARYQQTCDAFNALSTVPYSVEELRAIKGRYVLVSMPRMTARQVVAFAARKGLQAIINCQLNEDVLDELVIPAGWYLIKKTDAPVDRNGDLKMPRGGGAFVLLFAAAATRSHESEDTPLNGSSSETTWKALRNVEFDVWRTYRAATLINRVGTAYVMVSPDFRGRPLHRDA